MPPRKKQQKRNISGFRNQGPPQETILPSQQTRPSSPDWPGDLDSDNSIDGDNDMDPEDFAWYWEVFGEVDSDLLKAPDMDLVDKEDGQGYEMDWDEDLDDDVFCEGMMEMAADCGDDAEDEDWIPMDVRKRRERREKERKERPSKYVTGPVIDNKAERTQQRYRNTRMGQTVLTGFGFSSGVVPHHRRNSSPPVVPTAKKSRSTAPSPQPDTSSEEPILPPVPATDPSTTSAISQELADMQDAADNSADMRDSDVNGPQNRSRLLAETDVVQEAADVNPEDGEEWELEAEVMNLIPKTVAQIRPWEELRDQIKVELKKKSKVLPLSKINQLMIIRNFATLRLKGYRKIAASIEIAQQWHKSEGIYFAHKVRALALHYQIFKQLPVERRGGERKSRSLLLDETVKTAACG
ncbi:hypothetical protein DFH08DRAFT_997826 [Mycena albidolilacea]|uniref:Uncharacterized protein n=1 Tax=Mycena albidolilacea TaxID=1033008 RepID=A0AAD7E7E1_9AGAR|nr:hypothetical protein DFH08DRAFT_997826 [Mycena albidolilacea]